MHISNVWNSTIIRHRRSTCYQTSCRHRRKYRATTVRRACRPSYLCSTQSRKPKTLTTRRQPIRRPRCPLMLTVSITSCRQSKIECWRWHCDGFQKSVKNSSGRITMSIFADVLFKSAFYLLTCMSHLGTSFVRFYQKITLPCSGDVVKEGLKVRVQGLVNWSSRTRIAILHYSVFNTLEAL